MDLDLRGRIPHICHERRERRASKFVCKKIQEERENYCFGLRLYRSSECIILLGEGGGKGHVGIGRR